MTGGLFQRLAAHAAATPDKTAVRFLEKGERETQSLTYAELASETARLAGGLRARGIAGRPVILAIPAGTAFVTALLAVISAGAIAVPVPFPPLGEGRNRFRTIVRAIPDAMILAATPGIVEAGDPALGERLLDLGALMQAFDGPATPPDQPGPDAPAVIQFSSGSTAQPRGIVVTHGNIAANVAMMADGFALDRTSVCVHWLPPHHDMGLFGAILAPLWFGAEAVLMPAFAFLQKPLRWLAAISGHGGTITGGPNFAYELCLRRIGEVDLARLDLSRLRVAYCGAEPVRAASLAAFAAHTAPAGFRPEALLPCYGLAEATLLVSGTTGRGLLTESTVVFGRKAERAICGTPPPGCTVTIRDPQSGAPLPPGETGEICVSGAHVAAGEWRAASGRIVPLANAALSEDGERYLRTGDLGFVAPEGLVVVDRIKDMICLQGRNIHAVDVESAAVAAGGGAIAAAAAFAVDDDAKEHVVLLCEVPARERASLDPALERRLAAAIGADCGVRPQIVWMRHGALPRTTSGKIRRQTARQDFMEGRVLSLAIEMRHAQTPD